MHHHFASRYASHLYRSAFSEVLGSGVVGTPPIFGGKLFYLQLELFCLQLSCLAYSLFTCLDKKAPAVSKEAQIVSNKAPIVSKKAPSVSKKAQNTTVSKEAHRQEASIT